MTVRFGAILLAGLAAATAGAIGAQAHTPYLLPNAFDAERDHVTLQGALTEDDYFRPDIALKATSYLETEPSGETIPLAPAIVLKDVAVVEAPLAAPGTYRFSTGPMAGRRMRMAEVAGRWTMVRPAEAPDHRPEHADGSGHAGPGHPGEGRNGDQPPPIAEADLPPGAPVVEVENVSTAETFVSRGAPSDTALKPIGKGLELRPLTHPNAVYVDAGFAFQLLVDGQPLAGAPVDVYREGSAYDDRKLTASLKTGADGGAKVAFERPGVYLLTARTPGRRPGDAPAPRNYVYSLTFEVSR